MFQVRRISKVSNLVIFNTGTLLSLGPPFASPERFPPIMLPLCQTDGHECRGDTQGKRNDMYFPM